MERFWLQRVSDDFCKGVYDCPDMDIELHETDCVVSTNAVLMDMARDGAPVGTVLWAHAQEGGRGRLGRSFSSPRGGVYISMLLPSPQDFNDIGFSLTAKTGVAVRRAIKDVCGADCGIKWVNDIVLDGRKVCGVLAQMVSRKPTSEDRCLFGGASGCVVMGIGVNYETPMSCFDEGLRDIVGSLYGCDGILSCRGAGEGLLDESLQKEGLLKEGLSAKSSEVARPMGIPPTTSPPMTPPPMRTFVLSLIGHVYGLVCGAEACDGTSGSGGLSVCGDPAKSSGSTKRQAIAGCQGLETCKGPAKCQGSSKCQGSAKCHENTPKWLDEYKSSSTILGNEVKVIQAGCVVGEGVATSIDDDCHLHVRLSDGGEMVLSTGEVSVRESSKRRL